MYEKAIAQFWFRRIFETWQIPAITVEFLLNSPPSRHNNTIVYSRWFKKLKRSSISSIHFFLLYSRRFRSFAFLFAIACKTLSIFIIPRIFVWSNLNVEEKKFEKSIKSIGKWKVYYKILQMRNISRREK